MQRASDRQVALCCFSTHQRPFWQSFDSLRLRLLLLLLKRECSTHGQWWRQRCQRESCYLLVESWLLLWRLMCRTRLTVTQNGRMKGFSCLPYTCGCIQLILQEADGVL